MSGPPGQKGTARDLRAELSDLSHKILARIGLRWLKRISGYGLARGADLLIHDAQYTEAEYEEHIGWGHSSIRQAMSYASIAGVARLVAIHHDPAREDSEIDRMIEEAATSYEPPFELVAGEEGAVLKSPRTHRRRAPAPCYLSASRSAGEARFRDVTARV